MFLTSMPRRLSGILVTVGLAILLWIFFFPFSKRLREVDSERSGHDIGPFDHQPAYPQTGKHPRHWEIFSNSTSDKKFFSLKFGSQDATNANIIPSAIKEDTWVIVAVMQQTDVPHTLWFAELVCDAQFKHGQLQCLKEPMILPIASTNSDKCTGDTFGFWGLNVGPHDARVFYGPEHPYIIYGTNSKYSCFGLFMQDFRMLVDWGIPVWPDEYFRLATDLQRPGKHNPVEKNWFAFWDPQKNLYIQYDTLPYRSFAQVEKDGSAGPDLGVHIRKHDQACLQQYLPKLPEDDRDNTIHQATNSLAITLCRRTDPDCQVNQYTTFVMTVVQHKTLVDGHAEYDPYVYLFHQWRPFELYGVSKKPFWVHGRKDVTLTDQTTEHTEMFYITSMSWKRHDQKYHGYLDDIMFISFGIEDNRPGAIDIVAGDLLQTIGLCSRI